MDGGDGDVADLLAIEARRLAAGGRALRLGGRDAHGRDGGGGGGGHESLAA